MMHEADFERAVTNDKLQRARAVISDPDLHSTAALIEAADVLRNSPNQLDNQIADSFDYFYELEPRNVTGFILAVIIAAVIAIAVLAFLVSALGVTMADLDPTGTVAQVQHPDFNLEQTIIEARK